MSNARDVPNTRSTKHVSFIFILILAIGLRLGTFYTSHPIGDELFYHAVAMKLDREGFKGYSLQNVGLAVQGPVTKIDIEPDPNKTYLASQKRLGRYYYDEPLFYSPPLFPYLICFSHKIFASNSDYQFINKHYYAGFHDNDVYLDIVPLIFSILMIPLTYVFCLFFIDQEAGLLACLFLSVSPVAILSADRIWSDSTLAFFMFASALFFLLSNHKSNVWLAVGGGILSGLAVLTKVSGIFVPFILGVYSLLIMASRSFQYKKLAINPEAKHYFILCFITLIISLPWFICVIQTFGNPLHFPSQFNIEEVDPWFAFVRHRPWFIYPVDILFQNPIWVLVIAGSIRGLRDRRSQLFLVTWTAILCLYLTFMIIGKENRYMLPAYPAIAILSACGFIDISEKLRKKSLKWLDATLKIALLASLCFSVIIAMNKINVLKNPEVTFLGNTF